MFWSSKKKKSKQAKDLLGIAYKVYNYRCDIIDPADAKNLADMIEEIEELIGDGKIDTPEYSKLCEKLEKLLVKCGGKIYPLSTLADYTDMIIVAGIVAIAIRSFFVQPFQIPTNSMYPSFYGMTAQVYGTQENPTPPSVPAKIVRMATQGASNYSLTAPKSGKLAIEIFNPYTEKNKGSFYAEIRPKMKFFVWPSQEKIHKFTIDNQEIEFAIPVDFPIDDVISQAFDISSPKVFEKSGRYYIDLGEVKQGENFLNFDILSGDMLFVDRFSYNFVKPSIGDSIVFKTKYCKGMTRMNGGVPDDKYYIKRLVGQGGDRLKIVGSTLMRNGEPIKGSDAFDLNAKQDGLYCGYKKEGDFKDFDYIDVSKDNYYAMGDNSANSLDSRYWGEVPKEALVGRSLIIFYPFTSRWGATK